MEKMGSVRSYSIGFGLAIILTLVAYLAVISGWFTQGGVIAIIATLATVQLVVQLVFFLHLGRDGVKWKAAAFYTMFIILVLIVGGSLWIMYNLDYNMMMSPETMQQHMIEESKKGF
jgi:cytochrome o ubiquinol oxidase operon protein cyoD